MNLKIAPKIKFRGRYKLSVKRPDGRERLSTPWFDNLITDNGLDLIYTTGGQAFGIQHFCVFCAVGSGSTPPQVTDSTLEAYVAGVAYYHADRFGATFFVEETVDEPAYWRAIATYRFGTGVAAGNLSEIAVGHAAGNLFSRALITDINGLPTTITVLADEVLDVTYELRSYIDKTDVPVAFSVSGTPHTGLLHPWNIDAPPSFTRAIGFAANQSAPNLHTYDATVLPDVYSSPGGAEDGVLGTLLAAYIPGTYTIESRHFFDLDRSNFTIGVMSYDAPFCKFIWSVSPEINKTNVHKLSMDVRLTWGRYVI